MFESSLKGDAAASPVLSLCRKLVFIALFEFVGPQGRQRRNAAQSLPCVKGGGKNQ
jgi:hypothetical protein